MNQTNETPTVKKKRGPKAKSSFYHVRWNTVGLNEDRAAELIGVPVKEIRRWDTDGAPAMAEKLLLLWDRKHVGCEGWNGWLFSRGVLMYKGRRWTAESILRQQDCEDALWKLKDEMEALQTWQGLFKAARKKVKSSFKR